MDAAHLRRVLRRTPTTPPFSNLVKNALVTGIAATTCKRTQLIINGPCILYFYTAGSELRRVHRYNPTTIRARRKMSSLRGPGEATTCVAVNHSAAFDQYCCSICITESSTGSERRRVLYTVRHSFRSLSISRQSIALVLTTKLGTNKRINATQTLTTK